MLVQSITFKRGATFSYAGMVNLPNPSSTWTATSKIRDANGALIADLSVTFQPPLSGSDQWRILMSAAPTITALWPLGTLYWDIRYTTGANVVILTPTITIQVLEAETHV